MTTGNRCGITRSCMVRILIVLLGVSSLVTMNAVYWYRPRMTSTTSLNILDDITSDRYDENTKKSTTVSMAMENYTERVPQACGYRRHIAFIKVHKAGSSSIANILFRFGVAHNLTFLLPRDSVIISYIQDRPWKNILPPPDGKKFEILCSHAVYAKNELRRLMPADTMYIAIVREPFSLLNSVIYYFYSHRIYGSNKVKEFLKRPSFYNALKINKQRSFTNNSMSYELGLKTKNIFNKDKIREHLRVLEREFALVIIMERMEESLILLRRYLCWNLTDVLFIKRNVNKVKPKPERLTDKLRKRHAQMNMADYLLYDHFYKRLRNQIRREGTDFYEELTTYKTLQEQLRLFCLGLDEPRRSFIFLRATRWSNAINMSKIDCKPFLFGGIQILEYVKQYQYPKVNSNGNVYSP